MKRIVVDGIYLGMQMKGVGRYVANTLCHLADLDTVNEYRILVREHERLPQLPQNPRFHFIPIHPHNHYIHGGWTLPEYARQLQADLVLIPYETTLGVFPCPYVVVCHDVPPLMSRAQRAAGSHVAPQRRVIDALDSFLIRRSLRHASVVFANSHFVGNWLQDGFGIPADLIRYAPCAPGADFAALSQTIDRDAVRRKLDCPAGYILIFATGDRRENLDTALCVYASLVAQGVMLNLVIAGVRENDSGTVRARINPYAWNDRVRLLPFYGEDQVMNLAEAYAGASVYLDLSLHEGFGMQVIEAMACGTPVVCSNRGALPEVAGDAAILVDPDDTNGVANAVEQLLSDSDRGRCLVERGWQQAARYSWRQTAHVILQSLVSA